MKNFFKRGVVTNTTEKEAAEGEMAEESVQSDAAEGDEVMSEVESSDIPGESQTESIESRSDIEEGLEVEGPSSIITALQLEVKEHYDKYIRAVAELENFKKRAAKERSELIKYSGENLARDLLDVVDNLERAVVQATTGADAAKADDPVLAGVKLILANFKSIFDRYGIRGESALGSKFDPNRHEALASAPRNDVTPGTILEEFRKSYFYKDKLLRPGQVVVASAPVEAPPVAESTEPLEEAAPDQEE